VSRAIEQKQNLDGFVKPGELVEMRAGAGLSLHDRRIFNLLIENAWSEIGEARTHRIAIARLRGPRHKGGERVADSVKALMTSLVEVPATLEGKPAILAMQLLGPTTRTMDEDSPNALVEYEFPEKLRAVIQQSRFWGRIKSHVMFTFTSKYALTLYEAVCLRANLRVCEQSFSVDDFRALLGVEPGKLEQPFNFKKWALDPAVTEVNALSDFNVEVEMLRDGGMQRGKLKGFRLRWEKKSQAEWGAVLDELVRSKVGRKARIRGKVEAVI
jgi:hypothetical protein